MQAGLVWSILETTDLPPKLDGHSLRYNDPGDILEMLSTAVGPPTGVCILEDTVVGASGWAQIPLSRQYDAITNRAAAFVAGAMNYLRVVGPDAVHVLDLLTPKDMTKLKVGHGAFVLFTTSAGTIDNEAIVLRTGEEEYLLSCGGPTKAPSWLPEALASYSRARVEQADIACFNIKGPLRMSAMNRLIHPADQAEVLGLRSFEAAHVRTPDGFPVWVLRTTIGVEMWGDARAMHHSWVRILEMPELVTPCGWDLLDIFRVECEDMVFGIYPIEIHGGTTLWEAGFSWMVSNKPRNYVGRSALHRTRLTRQLWLGGLAAPNDEADVPFLGEEIHTTDGEFAGYVTTGAFSPKHQRPLAFAHLKPWCRPEQAVVVGDDVWTVAALPFPAPGAHDAEVVPAQRRTA